MVQTTFDGDLVYTIPDELHEYWVKTIEQINQMEYGSQQWVNARREFYDNFKQFIERSR